MAALPYMQLYVADYLADTAHLNAAQHGAYLLLLMNYWQRGKALKNDNERLANVARMSNEEWNKNRDVLEEFFHVTDGEWVHYRVEADLAAVLSKSAKASAAGKASAARRLNERSTDVQQTFNHTDTEADTNTEEKPIVADAPVTPNGATPSVGDELRNCFHQHCPTLPRIKLLTPTRKQALKQRWMQAGKDLGRYDPKDVPAGLIWWERFFQAVDASDFLSGRNGAFKASFDWLLKQTNFIKIVEGNYDNGARP